MKIRTATFEEMPQWKSAADAARRRIAELAASLAVGDVLHQVLSWENTSNIFYQVVKVDDQTISFRRLNVTAFSEHYGAGEESPLIDDFADDKIIVKGKRWLGGLKKWNGQPALYTYAN